MTRDVADTAQKLLLLAADGAEARTNEAIVAALRAARYFKEDSLVVTTSDPKVATCDMCKPATTPGQCYRCGYIGIGPGHACSNPDPEATCKVHATWYTAPPPRAASFFGGYVPPGHAPPSYQKPRSPYGYGPHAAYGIPQPVPAPPPYTPPSPSYSPEAAAFTPTEVEAISLRAELAAERIRANELEKDVERLLREIVELRRVPSAPPSPSTADVPIDEIYFMSMRELGLSARTHKVLRNWSCPKGVAGQLLYVGELAQCSVNDLLKVKYLGRKSLREIENLFYAMGLSLGTRIPDWPERLERWKADAARRAEQKESAA